MKFSVGQIWITVGKEHAVIVQLTDDGCRAWHDEDDKVHNHNRNGDVIDKDNLNPSDDALSYKLYDIIRGG